jgi:hypothetical protein
MSNNNNFVIVNNKEVGELILTEWDIRDTTITKYIIPYFVITIGDKAFFNCSALTTINIPDSVTTIGNKAFLSAVL